MSPSAIVVDRLSKTYRRGIDPTATHGKGLSGYLEQVRNLIRATHGIEFRALDNVSFDVAQGEVFGIVGRNGAGKSTMLKILARITLPSSGRAEIYGRVSSLLEVGTGFHPELTGRENVYLSGSILGMRKADISRRFDEIVAFSELEKFLDTPVKHYSSGMYVRLAFAVAAHLEPDVLLVDEVLAVGDTNFWTKSINKMRDLNAKGMTILLVSHDMWLIQTVCKRVICIDDGSIVADGAPISVINKYRELSLKVRNEKRPRVFKKPPARIVSLLTEQKEVSPDSGLTVSIRAEVKDARPIRLLLRITSPDGLHYFSVYSDPLQVAANTTAACEVSVPALMLMPGDYYLWAAVCEDDTDRTILAEDYLSLVVRGDTSNLHALNFFWNEADWRISTEEAVSLEESVS